MPFQKGQSGNPKGRKPGQPNKANAVLKAVAQKHGTEAIDTLTAIMRSGESEQAKIAAAKELLDRGYGRPPQAVTGDDGGPVEVIYRWAQ